MKHAAPPLNYLRRYLEELRQGPVRCSACYREFSTRSEFQRHARWCLTARLPLLLAAATVLAVAAVVFAQ